MPGNNLRSVIQQCSVVSRRRFFSTTSSEVKKDDLWIVGLRRLMVAGMVLGPILKRGALIGVGYGIASLLYGASYAQHLDNNEKLYKVLSKLPGPR